MTSPVVSIVIPAFNAEKYLGECIESVLRQDYPEKEILVIDDGSVDKTADVGRAYERDHKEVRFFQRFPNQGEYVTSRKGFEIATGDYICRLSADDYFMMDDHLTHQVDELEKTGADWCYNAGYWSGRTSKIPDSVRSMWMPVPHRFYTRGFAQYDNWFLSHPYLAFLIAVRRNPVNSSTLMVRRTAYADLKYFGDWRTDWDSQVLFWLLMHRKVGRSIPLSEVFYRLHSGQASHNPVYKKDMKEIRECVLGAVVAGEYPGWLKVIIKVMHGWLMKGY